MTGRKAERRFRPGFAFFCAVVVVCAALVSPGCASAASTRNVQTGKASYYAHSLAGRRTASGEPYDPKAFTAAHAKLPLGTVVRVTRPTGATVVVRINDRCGCGGGHIVDLSEAAARRLDMIRAGSVPVRLEVLRR